MQLSSKYNVGEAIFYMDGEKPCKARIEAIDIYFGNLKTDDNRTINSPALITYFIDKLNDKGDNESVFEEDAYASKEALIQGVFNKL